MSFETPKFEKPPMPSVEKKKIEEMKEKERKDIETLEGLPLVTQDRMNLILAYLDEKPTSEIIIEYNSKRPFIELEEVFSKKEDLKRKLAATGMKIKMRPE